ncbi:MAG: AbgT family transporter, partial [Nannocystaceae bacterium]
LLCLVALVGSLVPGGAYARDDAGRILPSTFAYDTTAAGPEGWSLLFAVLAAPVRGLVASADIVAFILVVGGTFRVLERSGALEAAIGRVVVSLQGHDRLFVPVSMLAFAVGGAVFGMSEEVIPFVLLFVPLVRGLGYPPIIAVAIPMIGAGVGFAGAMLNPFTVGVAQAIAGLPPMSGWPYRTAVWALMCIVGIAYTQRMATRLRRTPAQADALPEVPPMTRAQAIILVMFGAGIGLIALGLWRWQWYVIEIAAVFLGLGIAAALVARFDSQTTGQAFTEGAALLLPAGLIVGLARGIVVLAADMHTLDTMLYATSGAMEGLSPMTSAVGMFGFQSALNILVPSGSGQAALTMPIMAPLADLVGLTRQIAVLAFQLGDGFTNLITPTSAVLMGSLHAAGVGYGQWLRQTWALQVWLAVAGIAALGGAVATGFGP